MWHHAPADIEALVQSFAPNFDQECLLLTIEYEAIDPERWISGLRDLVHLVRLRNSGLRIVLVLHTWYKYFDINWLEIVDHVLWIDFFPWALHRRVIKDTVCKANPSWNSTSKNFLCLTGRAGRENRIRLLYKIHKAGLMQSCIHSLFVPRDSYLHIHGFVPEMDLPTFCRFVDRYQGSPDALNFQETYNGVPFDADIYQRSLFQLVSESGWYSNGPRGYVSEKTWLAVLNRVPFLIAGEYDTMASLRDLGLQTFQDTLLVPNYDDPTCEQYLNPVRSTSYHWDDQHWSQFYQDLCDPSWPHCASLSDMAKLPSFIQEEIQKNYRPPTWSESDQRLHAIVDNARDWLENLQKHRHSVYDQIEHNYQLLITLAERTQDTVVEFMQSFHLPCDDAAEVLLLDTRGARQ